MPYLAGCLRRWIDWHATSPRAITVHDVKAALTTGGVRIPSSKSAPQTGAKMLLGGEGGNPAVSLDLGAAGVTTLEVYTQRDVPGTDITGSVMSLAQISMLQG